MFCSLREESETSTEESLPSAMTLTDLTDKIAYAFQLATAQGPLCNEPVQGIAVFLEELCLAPSDSEQGHNKENLGRLTGEIIRTTRESIHQGFLDWSPRLLLAMYSCEIQASSMLRRMHSSHG